MPGTTVVATMTSHSQIRRWLTMAARTGLAVMLSLLLLPTLAHADEVYEPPPVTAGSNAVASCLAADQVWLYVVDGDGEILANQCVGTPASGEEALARGGMQIRFSKGRLICSLADHPDQCPAAFAGSYWNYHHAGSGEKYTYAKEGASTRRPDSGTIEAWCYNGRDEKSCTPPLLTIISGDQQILVPGVDAAEYVDPVPTANVAVPVPASTPWAFISTGAIIIVGIAALLWWRRRASPQDDRLGGR